MEMDVAGEHEYFAKVDINDATIVHCNLGKHIRYDCNHPKREPMLIVDLPTVSEFLDLRRKTADACVSLYLPTTAQSQKARSSSIELSNQIKTASKQLEVSGLDKRRLAALEGQIHDLVDDDEFWRNQANSLAVLATPDMVRTYRLANRLAQATMVSDRFHLNPLLRALAFPNAVFVLAISENAVRLVEVFPDLAPGEV